MTVEEVLEPFELEVVPYALVMKANRVIQNLGPDVPAFKSYLDSDGDIVLEWFVSPDQVIEIIVGSDNDTIAWAARYSGGVTRGHSGIESANYSLLLQIILQVAS